MTDRIFKVLDALGLDHESYRAILLLPLIEVAWADGEIQAPERETILGYGEGNQLLAGRAHDVVQDWLTNRPSDDFFERGRAVLVELAHDKEGLGRDIGFGAVDAVVEYCEVVAESSGGLFGMFFQTSQSETLAIRKIAEHIARLHQEHHRD